MKLVWVKEDMNFLATYCNCEGKSNLNCASEIPKDHTRNIEFVSVRFVLLEKV